MLVYVIRRVLLMFPTLLGITLMVFFVMSLAPGGVGGSLTNDQGNQDPDVAKAMREYYENRYHLKDNLFVQYLRWLNVISPFGRVHETGRQPGPMGFQETRPRLQPHQGKRHQRSDRRSCCR